MANEIATDIELLHKCLKGSSDAFGGIVAKYQSLVCAITYSATGGAALSEDMAQETFVNAWRNLPQLKDLSTFRVWLCSIARNVVRNYLRDKKQYPVTRGVQMESFDHIAGGGSEPVDTAISKEEKAAVWQALQRIPEEYREPLVLFYRQEQSVREVAAQLELSEEAVRTRLSRARLMLKNEVEAMIEKAVIRSRPGKAFTAAVMAGIAGIGVGSSSIAAAGITVAGTGTGAGAGAGGAVASGVMAGLTAKILTAAAVVAVGVGAVVAYKQIAKPNPAPDSSTTAAIVQQQQVQGPHMPAKAINENLQAAGLAANAPKTIDMPLQNSAPTALADANQVKPKTGILGIVIDKTTSKPTKGAGVIYSLSNTTKANVNRNIIEKAETMIRVIDENSNPVAGAVILPDGILSNTGHYMWRAELHGPASEVITDAQGIAKVSYPVYTTEKIKTEEISFKINHPEFCPDRPFWRIDGKSEPIVLKKGATMKVSAYLGSRDTLVKEFFPQVSDNQVMMDMSYWKKNDDGTLTTKQLSPGPHYLRAIYFAKNDRIYFSAPVYFEAVKAKNYEFTVELKPGVHVEGKLDDSVPRPIGNGRIVVRSYLADSKKEAGFFDWQTWRDIKENGTFEIESLPPGQGDIIALCDGFISKDPLDKQVGSIRNPQIFTIGGNIAHVEIKMEPAAICKVIVVDDKSNPLQGARAAFWPNIKWTESGTQIFGLKAFKSEDVFALGGKVDFDKVVKEKDFFATTDANGVAIVKNLPPTEQSFSVTHPDYEMPIQKLAYGERRQQAVNLSGGKTTSVTVKMQKKGTQLLTGKISNSSADGDKRAIICGMNQPDDSVGIFDPNANQNEFEGRVVDEAGKPIEGVLADAWTWYSGNEVYTDANGSFRLTNFKDDKFIEVRFSKENYSPLLIVRQQTGVRSAIIVLNDKTYFEGMVKGANGLPVADALIRADQGPKQAVGVMITSIWTETKSGADGRYRLYVQPDKYDIQVKADRFGVARLQNIVIDPNRGKPLDITLNQGAVFRAEIVDSVSDKPVAGVRLWNWQHKDIEGRSDANGAVVIEGMLPGKFEFMVDAPGYARWWSEQCLSEWNRFMIDDTKSGWQRNFDNLDFDIKEGMEPVVIIIEKAVHIRGRIVDPNGNPVEGATAAPARTGSGNSLTGDTRFSVTTKSDGTFEMLLPASGNCQYNLVAHDGGYQQWRMWANGVTEPFKTIPGQEINDVVITLTKPGTVTGYIVDEKGLPVANREVRAQAVDKLDNRYYDATVKTDANGNYELKFVRPCKQYIQVAPFWLDAAQAPEGTSRLVDVNAGQVIYDVNLVAESPAARQ